MVEKRTALRHILGYSTGTGFFLILIPYSLWRMSFINHFLFQTPLIPVDLFRIPIFAILFLIGAFFAAWSNFYLFTRGKGGPTDGAGISISPRSRFLVTEGPYRYTRNPMVFGVNSIYLSLAIYLNSLGCLLVWILFLLTLVRVVLLKEEKRLLKDFGDAYVLYKNRTSMILPLPQKRL